MDEGLGDVLPLRERLQSEPDSGGKCPCPWQGLELDYPKAPSIPPRPFRDSVIRSRDPTHHFPKASKIPLLEIPSQPCWELFLIFNPENDV